MIAIANSFVDSVRQFLIGLFKRLQTPAAILPEVAQEVVKREPRKPRKYNKEKSETLSDLLDNLDHTFESIKFPTMKESWLERDSVIGLKKLGVHIPNPWAMFDYDDARVDTTKPLPAMMCVSFATADTVNTEDKFYPKIYFAIKLKKLPWYVEKNLGTPYQFGAAFDWRGKLFWVHMYITVVKSTGEIRFCDELKVRANTVSRGKTFYSKSWSGPSYLEDDMRPVTENQRTVKNVFVTLHDWWSKRDERWNVVVKKNGERVTFGVNNDQTPYYFKDRDKSIKTASGQTKKIVHYVKEHERKVNDKTIIIKEHIRGLQEFDWAGYKCQVVSPKLQVRTSAEFTVPGEEKIEPSNNVVYLSRVGKLLADAEEIHKPKKAA